MLRNKQRVYPGENHSYFLIRWLNQVPDGGVTARIASLIKLCKQLGDPDLPRHLPSASIDPHRPGLIGSKEQFSNFRRVSVLVNKVNRLLATFSLRPRYEQTGRPGWRILWINATNRGRLKIGTRAGGNYDEISFGEGDALSSVLRLIERGRIHRLRQCRCGSWFYARFEHQRFCRMPCQQKDFRRTDEYRSKRRQYMRDYRTLMAKRAGRRFRVRLARRRTAP